MKCRLDPFGTTQSIYVALKASPKAKTVSELKITLQKLWDNIPQVQLTKLSQNCPKFYKEVEST